MEGEWKRVAYMYFRVDAVQVEIIDGELGDLTEIVYVWTTESGEWIRVGTSKAPVKGRLLAYAKDINNALNGARSPTLATEAAEWKRILLEGRLIAVVHRPPPTDSIADPVRPYLDIERVLIASKRPPLNRGFR